VKHLTNNIEKVMVILRDGRKLQGVFRSYDQYGELFFQVYGVNAKLHLLLASLHRSSLDSFLDTYGL
jgi:hypothetical protein